MKAPFLLPLLSLLLFSCNNQKEYYIPNYFKHGMKGNVESVYTHSYIIKDGNKEEYPKNLMFLWGDKFSMSCSRQQFDPDGNIITLTTYIDWATFTDSTIVTYNYQDGRLISSTKTTYSKEYSAPSTSAFVYTEAGILDQWDGKLFKTNEDNQIYEIDSKFKVNELEIQHRELFNDQGTMTQLYDMKTNKLSISNSFDKNGNIIQQEDYSTVFSTSCRDTIVYSQFDELGNWIQRKKINVSSGDTIIQCRSIHYYK